MTVCEKLMYKENALSSGVYAGLSGLSHLVEHHIDVYQRLVIKKYLFMEMTL